MNTRVAVFGFRKIVLTFCVAALMAAAFTALAAQPGSFEIRRVVDEKDSTTAEALPFADVRPGGESSLRVMKESVLDRSDVGHAVAQKDPRTGNNEVLVTLTEKGKERFARLTEGSIGKRLAVVVDGKIVAAPVVRTKISGGSLVITGNFDAEEASELAEKLNNQPGVKR
jgi:preprotein translocase subunit SecD